MLLSFGLFDIPLYNLYYDVCVSHCVGTITRRRMSGPTFRSFSDPTNGGQPFVLCPDLYDEWSPPERREVFRRQGTNWFCDQNGGNGCFPSFRWWLFRTKEALIPQKQIEKRNWVFLERKMGITGVPFGRTELSLRLSWTEFGALASRGGPEGPRV